MALRHNLDFRAFSVLAIELSSRLEGGEQSENLIGQAGTFAEAIAKLKE